jgi:hypothetical protein
MAELQTPRRRHLLPRRAYTFYLDPRLVDRARREVSETDMVRSIEAALAAAIDDRSDLAEAKTLVRKLRFLQRVRQEITDALIEAEA